MKTIDRLKNFRGCSINDLDRIVLSEIIEIFEKEEAKRKIIKERIYTALSEVRLQIKVLQFDLEATRQERDEALRKL